ncbi:MAG: HTH-type transcriptional repressor FabR [Alcanivoracaceae bacterium]|nr:HTH-type transcriptional repressor FabR [Alcanivoracaceae bacterium]
MTRTTRGRRRDEEQPEGGRRDARKQRTRRALLDAALDLMQGEQSFNSISLREVARNAGVVPTAFYRHFKDMDELGLALVEEALRALRQMMREARAAPLPTSHLIRRSVRTYLRYVQDNERYFQFVAKERFGGSRGIRLAIRQGIQLFISELSTDLARWPFLSRFSTEELQMFSTMIVNLMINITELLLDLPYDDDEEVEALSHLAEQQMLLIFLGTGQWIPKAERRARKEAKENSASNG